MPETHDLADVRGQDLINFPALQDRAAKVMTGDGRSSALDGCLLGPDIEDIMQRARVKKREVPQCVDLSRKAKKADTVDLEEIDDDVAPPDKVTPKTRGTEFKLRTAINSVGRTYARHIAKLRENMQTVLLDIDDPVLACQQKNELDKYHSEIAVMMGRHKLLETVMTGTPASLVELVAGSKVSPCAGYENLQVFQHLEDHKAIIRKALSQEDLQAKYDMMEPMKKLYVVLCDACKAALNDLLSARTAEEQRKKADEVKPQETDKRKYCEKSSNRAAKKSSQAVPPALTFWRDGVEMMHGRVGATYDKAWGCREPFLVSDNEHMKRLLDKDVMKTSAADFAVTWETCPLRTTQGRAQLRLPESLGRETALELEPLLMNHEISVNVAECAKTLDGCVEWDEVARVTSPALYVMLAGHISTGQIEINGLACFRVNMRGMRNVVMVDSMSVLAYLKATLGETTKEPHVRDAPAWLTTASHDDLRDFLAADHRLYMTTVGVGDLLYIPAGFTYCHHVSSDEDVLGVRIGAVSLGDEMVLRPLQDDYIQRRGGENPVLSQALTFLELRNKVSPSTVGAMGHGNKGPSAAATVSHTDSPSEENKCADEVS